MSVDYLLDANVFIQAHQERYPFDVFPGFWNWLKDQNDNGLIASIDPIYRELNNSSTADALSNWTKTLNKKNWFLPVDDEQCQTIFQNIADVTKGNENYRQAAKDLFLDVADPWIIAKAKSMGASVVTQEKSAPDSKRKIHIPDVCRQFDVPFINLIQMIRELGAKF